MKLQTEIKASKIDNGLNNTVFGKKEMIKEQKSTYTTQLIYVCETWLTNKEYKRVIKCNTNGIVKENSIKTKMNGCRSENTKAELRKEPIERNINEQKLNWFERWKETI